MRETEEVGEDDEEEEAEWGGGSSFSGYKN